MISEEDFARPKTKSVIVLTAALDPITTVRTAPSERSERRDQYRSALDAWVRTAEAVSATLCVVETTGAQPSELWSGSGILFFSRAPQLSLAERGKGALEADALDFAVRRLMDELDADTTMHKATGRLTVQNASACLQPLPNRATVRVRRTVDRRYCDTRIFSTTLGAWNEWFTDMASDVDDSQGRFIEHAFARRLIDREFSQDVSVERFATRPLIRGVSGSTGAKYGGLLSSTTARLFEPFEKHVLSRIAQKQM